MPSNVPHPSPETFFMAVLRSAWCVLFAVGAVFAAQTQTTLQLPLNPGRINPGTDLKQLSNGDYLLSSYFPGASLFDGGDGNLTRFNLQDGVLWSKDVFFELPSGGSFVADWPQESALLATAFLLDTFYNKALVKLDSQGNVLWSRRYGKPNDVSSVGIFNGKTLAAPLADGNALLAGGATALFSNAGANDLFVAKIDPNGDIVWARNLCFSCLGDVDAALGNVIPVSTGGFLMTGIVERNNGQNNEDLLLVRLTDNGEVQWARAYNNPGAILSSDDRGAEVKELPNGHFVVSGTLSNFVSDISDGLLLETDASGNFIRSVAVRIANSDHEVLLPHLEVLDDNTVVVTGSTSQDTLAGAAVQLNFLARIQLNGTVDWRHSWYTEALLGFGTATNALLQGPDGGFAYLLNYHENFELLHPILLLTDENGETGCEEPLFLTTVTSNLYSVSNLNLTAEPLTFSEDYAPISEDFDGFVVDLPYPDLGPDRADCPPFNILLNAQTPGVDQYRWSTGDSTPSISVTAPGEYAVTVTDNAFCFSAADTVRVDASSELPTATIQSDTTGFCESGVIRLNGTVEGADTLFWSTGATGLVIEVDSAGEYTLTAVNACGADTAFISLELPACDTLIGECALEVPNAFTPNGDGVNDVFKPYEPDDRCLDPERYSFRIFSRWGELVFESQSLQEGWNGEFRNQNAASDVYVWYLQYDDADQGTVIKKGDVTLLR